MSIKLNWENFCLTRLSKEPGYDPIAASGKPSPDDWAETTNPGPNKAHCDIIVNVYNFQKRSTYSLSGDKSSHTMDNILDFYQDAENDGLNIMWAHAVNSKAFLEESCNGMSIIPLF